ncbi:hypothetical protein QC763_120005 [Podospora pseudopauciseta]|uniref:Uncharacterized protein n=1 Tax=Podospora pseudopauciseta TaxID=2093780 RepID=A0ABR0I1Z0_9PEZI|nr:hypothetical protein QC763_120005 [Podospora pseudopauciseta]
MPHHGHAVCQLPFCLDHPASLVHISFLGGILLFYSGDILLLDPCLILKHILAMSPFEIRVHCYTLESPSNEHHHLESPINILSSLTADPPPSHIITRARGGTRDNHVAYISISSLIVTQPFERRSYCHGIVESDSPWPSEKGDKVWLRSDVPLLVGHKGVPVYNITKGLCCEVWIDCVGWRWDKQSISSAPQARRPDPRRLILAGPARNGGVGTGIMSRDDDSAAKMQMVIISAGEGSPTRDEGKIQGGQVLRGGYRHHHQQQQTQNQIRCLTVRELEEGWEDVIGKRGTLLGSGSNNGGENVKVKRRAVVKKMLM